MQEIQSIFQRFQFTEEDEHSIKAALGQPVVNAYFRSFLSEKLTEHLMTNLSNYEEGRNVLIDTAYIKGMIDALLPVIGFATLSAPEQEMLAKFGDIKPEGEN